MRNVYETSIGHFHPRARAASCGAAELVDPKMRQSTDFPGWLQVSGHHRGGGGGSCGGGSDGMQEPETQAKLEGKDVLM